MHFIPAQRTVLRNAGVMINVRIALQHRLYMQCYCEHHSDCNLKIACGTMSLYRDQVHFVTLMFDSIKPFLTVQRSACHLVHTMYSSMRACTFDSVFEDVCNFISLSAAGRSWTVLSGSCVQLY